MKQAGKRRACTCSRAVGWVHRRLDGGFLDIADHFVDILIGIHDQERDAGVAPLVERADGAPASIRLQAVLDGAGELARLASGTAVGVEDEGVPPDAVSAAIEHALFDENPKTRYLVVPRQREAGWTIAKAMDEMLTLNARHDHSYTRDELVELMDAFWPFAIGEKSFDDEEADAEMEAFFGAWSTRQGKAAE